MQIFNVVIVGGSLLFLGISGIAMVYVVIKYIIRTVKGARGNE